MVMVVVVVVMVLVTMTDVSRSGAVSGSSLASAPDEAVLAMQ
jgi:hypothetical protein